MKINVSFDKKIEKIEEIFDFDYFYLFLDKLLIVAQLNKRCEALCLDMKEKQEMAKRMLFVLVVIYLFSECLERAAQFRNS